MTDSTTDPPATPEPTPTPEPAPNRRDVIANLNAIEQLALYWGGETGVKIRNHVGRLRGLLNIV